MKIGILQTGHAPDALREGLGDYAAMFERLLGGRGFEFVTWNVVDMDFPAGVHEADGWLVTGSRHGAYEDHPFIPPLEAFIRDAHAAGVPMVGVCFGHQIIAQALGGRVAKFPGGWAVGRTAYDWQGETVHLNAWHQDHVMEVPEGAEVIATNAFCQNAAILYGDRAFTVQAHPEFTHEAIEGLITHRGGAVEPDRLDWAKSQLGQPVDGDRLARMIAGFFTERRLS